MLRITSQTTSPGTTMIAEGSLCGPWVHELQSQIQSAHPPVALDLSGVSFIDAAGAAMLEQARDRGVLIKAASHFVALMLQKSSPHSTDCLPRKE
jgi:anti-anti-sigma regulatory factor